MAKQMSFSSIRLPSKSDIFISGHAIIFTINFINRFTICHHMKVTISFCNTSKCGFLCKYICRCAINIRA